MTQTAFGQAVRPPDAAPAAPAVRRLDRSDLTAIADVHLAAFTTSALTALGPETVRRYYEWQFTGPHRLWAFGVELDGRLAGFCLGGVFSGSMSGFLRQNRMFLLSRLVARPGLAVAPFMRRRLPAALRSLVAGWRRIPPADAAGREREASFGILAIAVRPDCQGKGLGQRLMERSEHTARADGFGRMHLHVHPQNRQAVRFYEASGWQRIGEPGEWAGNMVKQLGARA
jgi:ribosomal protein S18 acetylase RimI-like enzyme